MSDYDNEDDIRFGRSFLSVGQVDDIIAKRDSLEAERDALLKARNGYRQDYNDTLACLRNERKIVAGIIAERDWMRQVLEEAKQAFETINAVSSPNAERTMVDGASRDLSWCCDESRRALARIRDILGGENG